jgi:hypothetical protein
MATKYIKWKSGYRSIIDPSVAYEELERIRQDNDGYLSAATVVDSARSLKSPIHDEIFRLGMKRAADEHYKHQARTMIRSVVIVEDEEVDAEPQRAFIHVIAESEDNGDSASVYASTEEAMADPAYRMQILEAAKRELDIFRTKYRQLQELAAVLAAIDEQLEVGVEIASD